VSFEQNSTTSSPQNITVNKTKIMGFYQVVSSWWKEYLKCHPIQTS